MKRYAWTLVLLAFGCNTATLTNSTIEGNLAPGDPPGWKLGRNASESYRFYLDSANKYGGERSAVLLSTSASGSEFGAFSQTVAADAYAGKRIRFSAYVKSKLVREWSGLWCRVDTEELQGVAFDNMDDRPVVGTTDWTRCEIVLDVPENAAMIRFGALLSGTGQVWVDECALEVVGEDVKTTGMWAQGFDKREPVPMGLATSPANMGFER